MFSQYSQAAKIAKSIESFMDKGMTDKSKIFTAVVDELNVPRPTVRRVAKDMKENWIKYTKILMAEPGQKVEL